MAASVLTKLLWSDPPIQKLLSVMIEQFAALLMQSDQPAHAWPMLSELRFLQ